MRIVWVKNRSFGKPNHILMWLRVIEMKVWVWILVACKLVEQVMISGYNESE